MILHLYTYLRDAGEAIEQVGYSPEEPPSLVGWPKSHCGRPISAESPAPISHVSMVSETSLQDAEDANNKIWTTNFDLI
jgi:hypothetical protein